jgi:O-antigen/teichoic acid export membrane protein
VATNLIANYGGSIVVALLSLAFIPLYIKYLGIGGYGLVGFFLTLQSVFSILDFGLSTTLNRQLAAITARDDSQRDARDLVRTLEIIYWAVALLIGITVMVGAPFIAAHWVKSSVLAPATVERAIVLMGVAVALQWPSALYIGGLTGLERQVFLNSILVLVALIRGAGAVFVLATVAGTVPAFFAWQIVSSALQTVLAGFFLWRFLPQSAGPARFRLDLLRTVYRFAAGMMAIGILATILTQADKIVLSKVLRLEQFGYYMLAFTFGASLYRLISPVFTAVFPRLTQAASADPDALPDLYHRSAQVLSVASIPAAVIMIVFAPEVLLLWTRDPVTVRNTATTARLLVAGTAINGWMTIPYALQLAYGWTSLSLYVNIIAILVLTPSVYFAASRFGGVGAAAVWLILNLGYFVLAVQPMYRRYLTSERTRWYVVDIGIPLLVSLSVATIGKALWMEGLDRLEQLAMLAAVSAAALAAAALATPTVRMAIFAALRSVRNRAVAARCTEIPND